jgi:hypothetical protein
MLYELDVKDWQIDPPAEPEEQEEELDEYGQPVIVCPWEMEW